MLDDETIISLFFERQESAIKETALKYGKLLFKLSNNILFSSEDSRECVNDTYLALWNSIPPNKPDPFIAYVCRIVRNISVKKLRDKNSLKRKKENVPIEELSSDLFTNNTAENIEAKALGEAINRFLYGLGETERAIFVKRYWFCDSVTEIAESTELSENSIYKKLSHTRGRLKDYLIKEGFFYE